MPDDPGNLVVPFGKHKGLTVVELLAVDQPYAEWLAAQGWLAERFAALHAAIRTRGAVSDDTPEHNRLQARFLDPVFQIAFLLATQRSYMNAERVDAIRHEQEYRYTVVENYKYRMTYESIKVKERLASELKEAEITLTEPIHLYFKSKVQFEQHGVDVRLAWSFSLKPDGTGHSYRNCDIEIKPTLGDDFPSVMRQMARLEAHHIVIEEYTGRSIVLNDLRKMFASNYMRLTTVEEIEAEIPEAYIFLDAFSPRP